MESPCGLWFALEPSPQGSYLRGSITDRPPGATDGASSGDTEREQLLLKHAEASTCSSSSSSLQPSLVSVEHTGPTKPPRLTL